ncbi:MAG: exonuclease domain-containing protein, partial [Myxococcales bacterium]|nr:exonuclease domain-containing protein [Myxococcales bacterium]
GAVLVDPVSFAVTDSFQTFVRPVIHTRLTRFCTELTTIRQDQVDGAPGFTEAIRLLGRFAGPVAPRFCSWGDYDRNQLDREAKRNNVRLPLARDHLNVKAAFAEREGHKKRGLGGALQRVGLTFEGTAHRGIDDARNIARLLPWALGLRPF